MPFEQDESRWPVVVASSIGESTDADIDAFIGLSARVLARKQPHVMVIDASRAKNMCAEHRRRIGDWLGANDAELRRYRRAAVWIIPSTFVRGLTTAIYWLRPSPYPVKYFGKLDEGLAWARRLFEAPAA